MAQEGRRWGRTRQPSVARLVGRFAAAGLVALAFVAIFTAFASRRAGTDQAIAEAERVTATSAALIAADLDDAVLAGDPAALDRLDALVRGSVLRGSLVRVKLWRADGTIVYADEPRLIGERFELDGGELTVLDAGGTEAGVSDLDEPENRYETEAKLLEVYVRTETTTGEPLLFEAYFRYSGVVEVGRHLWAQFAPITIGALLLLQLVQLPLAWRMARRVVASQAQRERLLRHAIDASDAERRRIASDLHDGVVQDFTGVSLTLAAEGRRSAPDPQAVLDASASIRTGVKALRSLLVEIYPPNLLDEGLDSAVGDLLSNVAARGIATHLTVGSQPHHLDPDASTLLYRAAQETLRNVVRHSGATTVSVEFGVDGGSAVMTVVDDGRGFETAELDRRSAAGHVGLRSLAGLVADAGGSFEVWSAPGAGTRVDVRVPLRGSVGP